jgi:hypothetical protein
MSRVPFEPTVAALTDWLEKIPASKRYELCQFLTTPEARSAFAAQVDSAVVSLVKDHTYPEAAKILNCSKSNIQRRVTRHRERTGTVRPPRPRRNSVAQVDEGDQTP